MQLVWITLVLIHVKVALGVSVGEGEGLGPVPVGDGVGLGFVDVAVSGAPFAIHVVSAAISVLASGEPPIGIFPELTAEIIALFSG